MFSRAQLVILSAFTATLFILSHRSKNYLLRRQQQQQQQQQQLSSSTSSSTSSSSSLAEAALFVPIKRTIKDWESLAKKILPGYVYYYYSFRAGETTRLATRLAYDSIRIKTRVLVDVSRVDTSLSLFGQRLASPVIIAPSAFHVLAHAEGEQATAQGARAAGCAYSYNFMYSTVSAEAVAGGEGVRWLHTYLFKNRDLVLYSLKKAEQLGFSAVVVTCDHPHDRVRNHTSPCFGRDGDMEYLQAVMKFPNVANYWATRGVDYDHDVVGENDPSVTWEHIAWLKAHTSLPLICKGILSVEDAVLAVKNGANAIVVSNHGNRQTDCSPPALEILPQIVSALAMQQVDCKIFVDSGVETGAHVFKALALGAHGVMVGRPILWGLAVEGSEGVKQVLEDLRVDLEHQMKCSGCTSLQQIDSSLLC